MQAAVLQQFGQPLGLLDLPVPQPAADEILIRVQACGVCHSDLHIVDGDTPGFKASTKAQLIPGHEVVGTVAARGAEVRNLEHGQRVGVAWLHHACGECEWCTGGRENLCRKGVVTGMHVDGGYAEFMRAKASHALPIPDVLSSVEAAPLFCGGVTSYRALHQAGVGPGQRVAVVGVGGLGHLAVQIARAQHVALRAWRGGKLPILCGADESGVEQMIGVREIESPLWLSRRARGSLPSRAGAGRGSQPPGR